MQLDRQGQAVNLKDIVPTASVLATASSIAPVKPGPPPDEGLRAWTQVVVGHLIKPSPEAFRPHLAYTSSTIPKSCFYRPPKSHELAPCKSS